jgi:aminoglycoside phosphotransferase (APT) family kinase protein
VIIDEELARRLVARQFPDWADLPITPVERGGVDNRTFRLGRELTVRLPAGEWYALQVAKEQRWLPVLAPQLPLPIPTPIAQGEPGEGYPHAWSVYRWLEGQPAHGPITDLDDFATRLAGFLVALQQVDATDGPGPGRHNFFRGGPLSTYAEESEAAIDDLGKEVDADACRRMWSDALSAEWTGDPVWFHGDIAVGNLLTRGGRLAAVIDFGTSGVGDPACDVVIAWTRFSGTSRTAFRRTLGVDRRTWSRGRGWALWKALITLRGQLEDGPGTIPESRRVIDAVLADPT